MAPAGRCPRRSDRRRRRAPPDWPDDAYSQFFGHGEGRGLYDVRMLRTERHKLVYYPHDVDELYDEYDDPWELRNLAALPEYRSLHDRPPGAPGAADGGGRRPAPSLDEAAPH